VCLEPLSNRISFGDARNDSLDLESPVVNLEQKAPNIVFGAFRNRRRDYIDCLQGRKPRKHVCPSMISFEQISGGGYVGHASPEHLFRQIPELGFEGSMSVF
jgi:hypothetical protein